MPGGVGSGIGDVRIVVGTQFPLASVPGIKYSSVLLSHNGRIEIPAGGIKLFGGMSGR